MAEYLEHVRAIFVLYFWTAAPEHSGVLSWPSLSLEDDPRPGPPP